MKKGIFITFEGGEGSGKTTQIKSLAQKLNGQDIETVMTREPGGTPAGEAIRNVLVTGDTDKLSPHSEALLNYAARAEHLTRVILPALEKGVWVLCDRFNDSTFAYQGGDVANSFLEELDTQIVGKDQPDLTFLLDISPEIGLMRAGKRMENGPGNKEDRFEKKGLAFHTALRERFLSRAAQYEDRIIIVDASHTESEVEAIIWSHILKLYIN